LGKSWHDSVYSEKKHAPFASGTSVYGNGDPAVLSYGMLLWKKQGEYNRKRKKVKHNGKWRRDGNQPGTEAGRGV
jgi:hypothetical protein